jgi:membrane fusion protein (multidrug efflux system)
MEPATEPAGPAVEGASPRPRRWLQLRGVVRERPRALGLAVLGIILLGLIGGVLWWYFSSYQSTDDAQIDAHISAVSTRIAGTVVAVYVEDNQEVKRGQLLVELDPRDAEVALARAEADLALARAQLEAESPTVPITATTNANERTSATDDVRNARDAVAAAEREQEAASARLNEANANVARADADRARYRFLLDERAIPPERYDQVLATDKAQRAEVASARALLLAAGKTVDQQRARLQQALSRRDEVEHNAPRQLHIREANTQVRQAAVQAAEASVAQARLNLEYTRVLAPVDGVIGKRTVERGNRVQPGEALCAVVDLEHVWVTANFKETQVRHMRVGQAVRVHVDALKRNLDGKVESFAGASGARYSLLPPENATGNYVKVVQRLPVRIALAPGQDRQHRLRPGLSVEPRVHLR